MSELERLARAALSVAGGGSIDDPADGEYAKSVVRAILRELREPTEGMLDAALGHLVASNEQEEYLIACQRRDDERTWKATIDHILSEGNT